MRIALTNFTRRACRGRRAGMLLASAALVFAAVFVFSSGAAAASVQKKAAASAPVAARTAAARLAAAKKPGGVASAAKGLNTGITVHGHWVINVLTPDGKLVSHTEFENSLQSPPGGPAILAAVLGQKEIFGIWRINFWGAGACTPTSGCGLTQGQPLTTGCTSSNSSGPAGCFAGMPAPVVNGNGTVQLSGSLTIPSAATGGAIITTVVTQNNTCNANATITPSACVSNAVNSLGSAGFTLATSPGSFSQVTVNPGQIVQVTVTFSFS